MHCLLVRFEHDRILLDFFMKILHERLLWSIEGMRFQ